MASLGKIKVRLYDEIIKDHIESRIIGKAPESDIIRETHYLPYKPIVREEKATTKFQIMYQSHNLNHYLKSVQIQSFFWSVFSCTWAKYGYLLIYLRIQSVYGKIRTRKNFVFGQFSCSE